MPITFEARMVWPPEQCADACALYDEFGLWYAGKVKDLADHYQRQSTSPVIGAGGARMANGVGAIGQRPRQFHGAPPAGGSLTNARVHIPAAADIAATSADLLFGQPPDITVEGQKAASSRIEQYFNEGGLGSTLLEAGELASVYGGVYLRTSWDEEVADMPLWDAIPPDAAIPEWRSGWLVAVTFWRELRKLDGDERTWRHLERHEKGAVIHQLRASLDRDQLGDGQPLDKHPDTAVFKALADSAGVIKTGATRLTAEYLPNMRPNRGMRGSPLGRSDFADAVIPLFGDLDEAWSSWMRDLRLAKAKIIVPKIYLQNLGPGRGAYFDAEQEIFLAIESLGNGGGEQIKPVQFAIRVTEHEQTTMALFQQIIRAAGYSGQTFGLSTDVAATATEVNARERRTNSTRDRKVGYARPVLARLLLAALEMDIAKFKPKGVKADRPALEWPDWVGADPESTARVIQLLDAAKAVSTQTKVELAHPDWEETQVREEVARILDEGMPPPVPEPGAGAGPIVVTGPGQQPGQGQPQQQRDGKAGRGMPAGPPINGQQQPAPAVKAAGPRAGARRQPAAVAG